jgi:uncharacterized delta-60 repeat protein
MAANRAPIIGRIGGEVVTSLATSNDAASSVALQSNGKIVVTGYSSGGADSGVALLRYNADGTLDTSFGQGGKLVTSVASPSDIGASVVLQPDGRIVVAGSAGGSKADFAVLRYNADGSLDATFGQGGKVTTPVGSSYDFGYDVALQADGKIVVAGSTFTDRSNGFTSSDFAVLRYNTDGSLDMSFNGDGIVTTPIAGSSDAHSIALQPDGKIVVAGETDVGGYKDFAVVRYDAAGSLDNTFGPVSFGQGGIVTTRVGGLSDYAYAVALQSDGKIVVAGNTSTGPQTDFALARYDVDGSLDMTFDGDGIVTTSLSSGNDICTGVVVQPDGKIIVGGNSDPNGNGDFALLRYNADGSLDASFGQGGKVVTPLGASGDFGDTIALQPNGKIVVAGTSASAENSQYDFAVVRYNANGSLDATFGAARFTEGGSAVVIDADIVVSDAELAAQNSYGGASLTLLRAGGARGEDVFGASGTLARLSQGGALLVDGVVIGTVTQNSGGLLALSLNANASQARLDAALHQITYKNTSNAPPGAVSLVWTFADGNSGAQGDGGAKTASGTTLVAIKAVNDAAVIGGDLSRALAETNAALKATGKLTVADVDGAASFKAGTLAGSLGGKLALAANGAWSYAAASAHNEFAAGKTYAETFKVAAADGTLAAVTMRIAGTNDAPVITSGGGGAAAKLALAENRKALAALKAADAEGDKLAWSIVGGKDAKLFAINAGTGALAFKTAPDFEAPKDAGKNNSYDITVKVSDGKVSDTQALSIKVTDVKGVTKSGTPQPNTLTGALESDTLKGLGGKDTLNGGAGADKLLGGSGADRLTGGAGADIFVFTKLSDSTVAKAGRDTIYDFAHGDRLDLSAIDANGSAKGSPAFHFIGETEFGGHRGELRFDKAKSDTFVYTDVNGDKHADFGIHLDDAVKLVKGDFIL